MAKGGAREVCTVDGCEKRRVGWGLCSTHYQRQKSSGHVWPSHRSQARAETIGEDGTRKCWKCGERKLFTSDHFPDDIRRPGELKGTCRKCLKKAVKRAQVRRLYGVEVEYIDELLSKQAGLCAICKEPISQGGDVGPVGMKGKARRPHIDHCHDTGRVRGLLCHHCNVLLGHAKESPELLAAAINYLGGP